MAGSALYEKLGLPVSELTDHSAVVQLIFPADRYPETAAHIKEAIRAGQSRICTIHRGGAEENRKHSLHDVPTKKGYDRDEWPMAMCREGGQGADIKYITPADNRGAGSWVQNQLDKYPDGTQVEFVVK
ncbi:NucA/NucB deoxyribonuclease domain-containing protein [Paenibacillus konkukensis]|nr:NucA/NucB deoxyribonuclease domain-containing protein [Paenibacillus konkukensis]